MNGQSIALRAVTLSMLASTFFFVACGHNNALDARAAAPAKAEPQQFVPDPALNRPGAVTDHG